MAKLWTDFYDYVLPDVPSCSLGFARHHIREAVIEFCNRTCFWQVDLTTVVTTTATEYTLTAPTATLIIRPEYVELDGIQLFPRTEQELDLWDIKWRTATGNTLFYHMVTPKIMRLVPGPAAGQDLDIKVSIKPTSTATGMADDDIFDEYRSEIAAGAAGRILMVPKKPWSDPVMGAVKRQMFNAYCGSAAKRKLGNFTKTPRRVKTIDR